MRSNKPVPANTIRSKLAALDARAIVPVEDEIGGVVIYMAGHPAYYVLDGEWFEAFSTEGHLTNTRGSSHTVRVS